MLRVAKLLLFVAFLVGGMNSVVRADELDAAFEKLASYKHGQNRSFQTIINQALVNADGSELEALEAELIATLEKPGVTGAAIDYVCRALSGYGSQTAAPALAKLALRPRFTHLACLALNGIESPKSDEVLRSLLDKVSGVGIINVINTLADRGDKNSVTHFARLINNPDVAVAEAALAGLGKIADAEALRILIDARVADNLLLVWADSCLLCAESMVDDGDDAKALSAYNKLFDIKYPTVIRIGAFGGIVNVKRDNALPLIITLIKGEDDKLRQAAAVFSHKITSATATARLTDLLSQVPSPSQRLMINTLSFRGDKNAADGIAEFLNSNDDTVKAAAVRALADLGDGRHVKALAQIAAGGGNVGEIAQQTLALIGADADQSILDLLMTTNDMTKVALIKAVAARRIPHANGQLLTLAGEKNARVAGEAFKALGLTAGKDNIDAMLNLMITAESSAVRSAAEKSVIAVIIRENALLFATEPVIAVLTKANDKAKENVMAVMAVIGGEKTLQAVAEYVDAKNVNLKKAALRALALWPDALAAETLMKIAKSDPDKIMRILALRGYIEQLGMPSKRSEEQAYKLLAEAMDMSVRPDERKIVLASLANAPSIKAMEMAGAYVDDPALQQDACIAVIKIAETVWNIDKDGAKVILEKVVKLTKDNSARKKAKKILGKIK